MSAETPRRGKTVIAPDVLLTIARLSALGDRPERAGQVGEQFLELG